MGLKENEGNKTKFMWLVPSSLFFFIVVPYLTLNAARYIERIIGLPAYLQTPIGYAGLLLLAYGSYYMVESIRALLVEGGGVPLGDLVPDEQSNALLKEGVYSRTRNPMLFGYLVTLVGLGAIWGSPAAVFAFPPAYLGIWTAWIKGKEEPALEERFGESYKEYRERTPFLLPRCSRS